MITRLLAPGTYEITWTLPSAREKPYEAPGLIDLLPGRPPTGSIEHGDLDEWHKDERGLQLIPFRLPRLVGTADGTDRASPHG